MRVCVVDLLIMSSYHWYRGIPHAQNMSLRGTLLTINGELHLYWVTILPRESHLLANELRLLLYPPGIEGHDHWFYQVLLVNSMVRNNRSPDRLYSICVHLNISSGWVDAWELEQN